MFPVSGAEQLIASGASVDATTGDFGEGCVFEDRKAPTILGVGKKEVPESAGSGFLLQVFEYIRVVMRITRLLHLAAIDSFGWIDVAVHEFEQPFPVLSDKLAVGEVHFPDASSLDLRSVGRARRHSSTSEVFSGLEPAGYWWHR